MQYELARSRLISILPEFGMRPSSTGTANGRSPTAPAALPGGPPLAPGPVSRLDKSAPTQNSGVRKLSISPSRYS
jgi:hypothetical protein